MRITYYADANSTTNHPKKRAGGRAGDRIIHFSERALAIPCFCSPRSSTASAQQQKTMGKGRDGSQTLGIGLGSRLLRASSFESLTRLTQSSSIKDDLLVLRHIWFSRQKGDDHAARLESFYGPQAAACE